MIQSSAIFMVVAVSAERYRAVCHPMSKRQAQCPIWRIFHHFFFLKVQIFRKYRQVKLSKFILQHFVKIQFGISTYFASDTLKLMPFELFLFNYPQSLSQPSSGKENSARKSNSLDFSVNIPLLILFDTRSLTFKFISYLMQPTLAAKHE